MSGAFRMDFSETEIMDWVGYRSSAMVHHYRHQRPGASQQRMCSISFIADDTVSPANSPEPEMLQESEEMRERKWW